ncbi:hypothetical protein K505DRAFT_255545 [Melanomma pulvis-pyrius CBS 109.77]|uniref:Uncharacterized protein n=1 Tax=Melanomma pulvis-pyrius CBS 109.77 TaxID=1314802 RepID=A0A6A6WWI2_9PLEO|nr:hypothetical protein K505DRAFT_255545 [Melanomma pulvis-pyrius CBS 109.77]
MQYFKIILALAAAASAIDIRFHNGGDCNGGWIGCASIGPDNCCTSEAVHHPSVGFYAIPKNWKIGTRGFTNGGCSTLRASGDVFGVDTSCLRAGGNIFTGATYYFRNRKVAEATCETGQTCKSPQKPDLLGLEDGQKYQIADMEDHLLDVLIDFAFNGTTAADIPAVYEKFEIKE